MAKIILVRHGETDWDKEKRVRGTIDIPLNNEGKKEARDVSRLLEGFDINAVYSSPSTCCVSTALEIAAPHKLRVKKVRELKELYHGVWEGLRIEDIKKRYKKQYSAWKNSPINSAPPKGESISELYDRAVSAMHKMLDKHQGGNVCMVSGDMILNVMKCHLKNIEVDKIWKFSSDKTWWEAIEL